MEAASYKPPVILSSVKRDNKTVTLTSEDLFDRIINIRFVHKAKEPGAVPKTFTIRSDYDVEYSGGGYNYIVSRQKPAIKVEFKQVADDTVVELNVYVTNLFIKDPSQLEKNGEPIQQLEIQMGYRSQMLDWTKPPQNCWPISDFMALRDSGVQSESTARVAPTRLVAQVLSTQRISAPPDMVTHFQCVIGTVEPGLRWEFTAESLDNDVKTQKSKFWGANVLKNGLPNTFFLLVTRRFVRSTVRHNLVTEYSNTLLPINQGYTKQTMVVYNDDFTIKKSMDFDSGRMSVEDADTYGVVVYLSKVLWDTPLEELPMWGLTPEEVKVTQPITQVPTTRMMETVSAQLQQIVKDYPFIRYYLLSDGNYYAYHVKENSQAFFKDPFVLAEQKKSIIMLPAVYDITWGGTRQIRAPFCSLIGSMKTVAFQAKYALNDITGNFYHPKPENNCFLVLLSDVSFSTIGKDNMMTLTCVDIEGTFKPVVNADGSMMPAQPEADKPVVVRNKLWKKMTLTVVNKYAGDPDTISSSWTDIVQWLLLSAEQYSDKWTSGGGSLPSKVDALAFLGGLNPDLMYSGTRTNYAQSVESAPLGFVLPVLFGEEYNPFTPEVADKIVVKYPFLPNEYYTADREIKV